MGLGIGWNAETCLRLISRATTTRPMKVKDMILKQAIDERRAKDAEVMGKTGEFGNILA